MINGKLLMINSNRGTTLYLALIILAILTAIVFSVSSIILGQIKTMRGMGNSIIALYAADTGIEKKLYGMYQEGDFGDLYGNLDNNAAYQVIFLNPGEGNCPSDAYYCIKSIGTFRQTKRGLQAIGK